MRLTNHKPNKPNKPRKPNLERGIRYRGFFDYHGTESSRAVQQNNHKQPNKLPTLVTHPSIVHDLFAYGRRTDVLALQVAAPGRIQCCRACSLPLAVSRLQRAAPQGACSRRALQASSMARNGAPSLIVNERTKMIEPNDFHKIHPLTGSPGAYLPKLRYIAAHISNNRVQLGQRYAKIFIHY